MAENSDAIHCCLEHWKFDDDGQPFSKTAWARLANFCMYVRMTLHAFKVCCASLVGEKVVGLKPNQHDRLLRPVNCYRKGKASHKWSPAKSSSQDVLHVGLEQLGSLHVVLHMLCVTGVFVGK